MGIWGDAFEWAAKSGAKLLVKEGAETGTKVVAKTVVEDGTKVLAKNAAEDGTKVLAKNAAADAADMTGAALKTGDQTAAQAATATAGKSEGVVSRAWNWLTTKSSRSILYDTKLTRVQKLETLAGRGDEQSLKSMRQILDQAKIKGSGFTESEMERIRLNPNLSPELKNQANAAYKAANTSGVIANAANKATYVKDHALSLATHGAGQAAKGTASAAFKTVTWPARNFVSGAWDTLHFWNPLKVTKGLAKMGFSAVAGVAEVAGGDQLLTHGKGRKALVADVIGADNQQSVANGLASTGQFLDQHGIPGGGLARVAANTVGTPSPELATAKPKDTPDKTAGADSGHWYDWLKNMASSLTGSWAWLGVILSAIAWIAEQVTSLGGSLFSSGTKVQSNNPARVAAVAGTDPNIQAAVVNHNGQAQTSVLDRVVPQLAPPAPAPG